MRASGFLNPLLQPFNPFELLSVLLIVSLVNYPIHLVSAEAISCKIRSCDWLTGLIGWARLVVASHRCRTAPGCNGGLAGGLMLVVRRVRSRGFIEERGHPLNFIPDAAGYGLGLELQVPWLPVVRAGQKNSLVVIVGVHFFWIFGMELNPRVQVECASCFCWG